MWIVRAAKNPPNVPRVRRGGERRLPRGASHGSCILLQMSTKQKTNGKPKVDASSQLALFGIAPQLVTKKQTSKGSVSLHLVGQGAGAFGYMAPEYEKTADGKYVLDAEGKRVKVPESEEDREARLALNKDAKAKAEATRLQADNLIAEKGMPALQKLHDEGRIMFTGMNFTAKGGGITWKHVRKPAAKALPMNEQTVEEWLKNHPEFFAKMKNATPASAPASAECNG